MSSYALYKERETHHYKCKDFPFDLQNVSYPNSRLQFGCCVSEIRKHLSLQESRKEGRFLHVSATDRADLFHDIIEGRPDANIFKRHKNQSRKAKNIFFPLKVGDGFFKEKKYIAHLLGSRNPRELKGGNLTLFSGQ